jgi:hypothetical protein
LNLFHSSNTTVALTVVANLSLVRSEECSFQDRSSFVRQSVARVAKQLRRKHNTREEIVPSNAMHMIGDIIPGSVPKKGLECKRDNLPTSYATTLREHRMTRDMLVIDWNEGYPEENHILVESGDREKLKKLQ